MNTVSFLYPATKPDDAVLGLFQLMTKHAQRWRVRVDLTVQDSLSADVDVVVVVTTARYYTREAIDRDIAALQASGQRFVVLHHNDHGQPSPNDYPSAVWTRVGEQRLAADYPGVRFVRLPCFPPQLPPHNGPLLVGTFGIVEPKKRTLEMYRRCREIGVPFIAHGPVALAEEHADYLEACWAERVDVCLHRWVASMEEYGQWLARCSHFLFVLPPSKESTGGGSTSPKVSSLFNRPTILIDDERDSEADGFTVLDDLSQLTCDVLAAARPPSAAWSADACLDALAALAR